VVWNVLHPLAMIAVYATIFGAIMGNASDVVPGRWGVAIYLCTGFFPWIAFSDCITRGASALSGNATYLKKLPVPEQVFVAETVAAATITLVVSFSIFVLIALVLGARPTIYWLLLPVPMILLQAVGFGFGLIVSTLNVFFTDVAQLLGITLQVLFWLTPIVYPSSRVSTRFQLALRLNPATPGMDAIHDLFLWHKMPPAWTLIALTAWAVGTIGFGYFLLNRLRGEIRDVL